MLMKFISILSAVSIASSCVAPSVGAIKITEGVSAGATQKAEKINSNCAAWSKKLKKIKEKAEQLEKGSKEGKVFKSALISVKNDIDSCMKIIETLKGVSLKKADDKEFLQCEIDDNLNYISSKLRVLNYLIGHCELDKQGEYIKFIEPKGIGLEEYDELPQEEMNELKTKVENDKNGKRVKTSLSVYTMNVRDKLNDMKNTIMNAIENNAHDVAKKEESSNVNNKDNNKELFDKIDKLYDDKNDGSNGNTEQVIEIIKKRFPEKEQARLRAMVAFDVIKRYKEKNLEAINREKIIKELVEPVVREEMESNFNRCLENTSNVIAKKLNEINLKELIDSSIKFAAESDKVESLHDFCFAAFYGDDQHDGFYDILNREKKYWYGKYSQSGDCVVSPVIIDIVELNSLVLRLEELEHVGINAGNIRKISNTFDKIFNGNENSAGMYQILAGKKYNNEFDALTYTESHQYLHEMREGFTELVNGLLVDEKATNIQEKLKKAIENIKVSVKKVDDEYANQGKKGEIYDNENFCNIRSEFYNKMVDFDKWKKDNNLENLSDLDSWADFIMRNFKDNISKFKSSGLIQNNFIESFKRNNIKFNKYIDQVQKWTNYHKFRAEVERFFDNMEPYDDEIRIKWRNLFRKDSIFSMAVNNVLKYYNTVWNNPSAENISEMNKRVNRYITDMNNIRNHNFIFEYEKKVKEFTDKFYFEEDEKGNIFSYHLGAKECWDSVEKFRKYYEENRYDLGEEQINHLSSLCEEFDHLLKLIK